MASFRQDGCHVAKSSEQKIVRVLGDNPLAPGALVLDVPVLDAPVLDVSGLGLRGARI
jgi:hypothetical protein